MKNLLDIWRQGYRYLRHWLLSRRVPEEAMPHRGVVLFISLLLAFLLWFTASMRKTYTLSLEFPVRVEALPPDRALVTPPPERVRVQVQGEGWQLLQLYYRPPVLPLDLSQASSEEITLDLLEQMNRLNLPGGLRILNATPRQVRIRLAPRTFKWVPILLRGVFEPAPQYDFLQPPVLDPDSVRLSGAQPLLDSIQAWPTEYVERRNIRSDLRLQVPLSDTLASLIEKNVEYTTVFLRVALFTEGVREIPIRVTDVPPGLQVRLRPSTLQVVFRVPTFQYEQALEARDFYATVSYAQIQADTTGSVRPRIHLPTGLVIRDLRYQPSRVEYFIVLMR